MFFINDSVDAEHVLTSCCRGASQQRNVNVVTVYDIQNKFIGKNYIAVISLLNL